MNQFLPETTKKNLQLLSEGIKIFYSFVIVIEMGRMKNIWIYKGMNKCPGEFIMRPADM